MHEGTSGYPAPKPTHLGRRGALRPRSAPNPLTAREPLKGLPAPLPAVALCTLPPPTLGSRKRRLGELRKETDSSGGRPSGGRAGHHGPGTSRSPPQGPGRSGRGNPGPGGSKGQPGEPENYPCPPRPAPAAAARSTDQGMDGWTERPAEVRREGGHADPAPPTRKPACSPARKWAWLNHPEVGGYSHPFFRPLGWAGPGLPGSVRGRRPGRNQFKRFAPRFCARRTTRLLRTPGFWTPRPEGGVHPDRTLLVLSAPAGGLHPKYSCEYAESARGRRLARTPAAAGTVGRVGGNVRRPACPRSPGRGSCPHGACGPGVGSAGSRSAFLHLPLPLRLLKCRRLWSSRPGQATPSCPLDTNALLCRHELQINLTAAPLPGVRLFPLSTRSTLPEEHARLGRDGGGEMVGGAAQRSALRAALSALGQAVTAAVTTTFFPDPL